MNIRLAGFALVFSLALGGSAFALGTAASADPQPASTPIPLPSLPPTKSVDPYVQYGAEVLKVLIQRQNQNAQNNTRGTVSYFRRFDLQIQTGANSFRTVHLHQGTEINPRGTSLQNGMTVQVNGQAQSDGSINANQINVIQ